MGRPINKSKIGSGSGKISVTSYRFAGASEVLSTSTQAHIVSQKSTRKFSVTDGSTTEDLVLVNKSAGELAEGEMIINCQDDGTAGTMQVTKLMNRTVQVEVGTDGGADDSIAVAVYPYTISDAAAADDANVTVDSQ
jgi:hypothetical protein